MVEECQVTELEIAKKEKVINILIVDDDKSMAAMTALMLEEVLGEQAGRIIETHVLHDGSHLETFLLGYNGPLDVVVCDWEMPQLGGRDTYLLLRKYPRYEHTDFAFYSAGFNGVVIDILRKDPDFVDDPAIEFVHKEPTQKSIKEILETVDRFLKRRNSSFNQL